MSVYKDTICCKALLQVIYIHFGNEQETQIGFPIYLFFPFKFNLELSLRTIIYHSFTINALIHSICSLFRFSTVQFQ